MLTAIHAAVPIPMVGIGGINEKNIDKLYGTDIDGCGHGVCPYVRQGPAGGR